LEKTVLVDTGFLVALLRKNDAHRPWATSVAAEYSFPWLTCEPVLTEAFHFLGRSSGGIAALLQRGRLQVSFSLPDNQDAVLAMMSRYADVPISLADACLVRMSEIAPNPIILTLDGGFRMFRRHGRQVIPCVLPSDAPR
jgi:predicted nucleic acid-binding protein